MLQPLSTIAGPTRAESNPEHRKATPGGLTERLHEGEAGASDRVVLGDGGRGISLSPQTAREVGKEEESYFQPRPRRGNGTPRW